MRREFLRAATPTGNLKARVAGWKNKTREAVASLPRAKFQSELVTVAAAAALILFLPDSNGAHWLGGGFILLSGFAILTIQ